MSRGQRRAFANTYLKNSKRNSVWRFTRHLILSSDYCFITTVLVHDTWNSPKYTFLRKRIINEILKSNIGTKRTKNKTSIFVKLEAFFFNWDLLTHVHVKNAYPTVFPTARCITIFPCFSITTIRESESKNFYLVNIYLLKKFGKINGVYAKSSIHFRTHPPQSRIGSYSDRLKKLALSPEKI